MARVAVVGATGYVGAELVRLLAGHPAVELSLLTSRQYAGKKISEVYPALENVVDLPCETFSVETVDQQSDLVFTALPHRLPMEIVPALIGRGKRVIDMSADFRLKDAAVYEKHYQPHTAREFLAEAVYGLCEVYRDRIADARLVANPGCYPTSVILPLLPLLKRGLIVPETLIADSKSGVSGAGRSPSLTTLYCEVQESFKAYKVAGHRHNPEMNEVLSLETGRPVAITFTPHLVPMSRGMLSTCYAGLSNGADAATIDKCLREYYAGRPFVRLCATGRLPDTLHVRGTNFCDIGFRIDAANQRLILISAIDNLVKGAAGQAVQCMNIMLGLDEATGLTGIPFAL